MIEISGICFDLSHPAQLSSDIESSLLDPATNPKDNSRGKQAAYQHKETR